MSEGVQRIGENARVRDLRKRAASTGEDETGQGYGCSVEVGRRWQLRDRCDGDGAGGDGNERCEVTGRYD